MKKCFLPSLLFVILLFSCNSSGSKKENEKDKVTIQDFSQYETLVFSTERMDTLDFAERIKFFEEDGRIVQFFDESWKLIDKESASFVSTIKPLEKDLFLVKDYYINGENQMNGIYKALKTEVDWSQINEWDTKTAEARRVGKCVWFRNGRIDFMESYEYSNFEKGYGTSDRKEYQYPPKSKPVKVLIKKDSTDKRD